MKFSIFILILLCPLIVVAQDEDREEFISYFADGSIKEKGNFIYMKTDYGKMRVKYGIWNHYHPNGQIHVKESYKDGKLVSYENYFDDAISVASIKGKTRKKTLLFATTQMEKLKKCTPINIMSGMAHSNTFIRMERWS